MKYFDGLNYLDQLKDYVQTSISSRQNVHQTAIVQKIEHIEQIDEQGENTEHLADPLSFSEIGDQSSDSGKLGELPNMNEKVDEFKNEYKDEPSVDLDLIDVIKEEMINEGDIS